MSILSLDPNRRTNAQAILDAHTLGYIRDDDLVLDVTYGLGRFWKLWEPVDVLKNDLDPKCGEYHDDWRELRWEDGGFDVVVFDPDYKLQGTSSNEGPASSNADYGMDRDYRPVVEQLNLIKLGLMECRRVCKRGGMILVKTMDQVVSGAKVWLTKDTAAKMGKLGCRLVDEIHVYGHRAQPETRECKRCEGSGKNHGIVFDSIPPQYPDCVDCDGAGRIPIVQRHTHASFSTLMIFAKEKP